MYKFKSEVIDQLNKLGEDGEYVYDRGLAQLELEYNFGRYSSLLVTGCFGCGKTFTIMKACGRMCYNLYLKGITGYKILLIATTQTAVKANMCNVLTKVYGDNFKYDSGHKDGIDKDATLFGQYIYIRDLSNAQAYQRIRGLSDIFCVIQDEALFCTEEQFIEIKSRIRGTFSEREKGILKELGLQPGFYVGSTNTGAPTHWIKKDIDRGPNKMKYFDRVDNWDYTLAHWNGCKKYYRDLFRQYEGSDIFIRRYLKSEWVSQDGMIWSSFSEFNIISESVCEELKFNVNNFDYSIFNRVVIGIDWGEDHPTSIVVLGITLNKDAVVCDTYKLRKTAPSDMIEHIKDILYNIEKTHKVDCIYTDAGGIGAAFNEELRKNRIPYRNATKGHDLVLKVNSGFHRNKLAILYTCTDLINEIYSYVYDKNGNINKVGDDLCDALRYAYVEEL